MPGKRIQFDQATLTELTSLASDTMMDFQELAEEAFRDLLRKHHRPVDLKSALRQSAREAGASAASEDKASGNKRRVTKNTPVAKASKRGVKR